MSTQEDQERFRELFEQHRGAVLAYARRRVDGDAAADVVADTFLVTWRRLDDVPEDPLPWLYGVARRVVANQRRAGRRAESLMSALLRVPRAPAPEPGDGLLAADGVRAALDSLSERDREALRLVAWEGLDPERAAQAAGCSRAAFAVRLHRARKRLATALAADDIRPTRAVGVPHES